MSRKRPRRPNVGHVNKPGPESELRKLRRALKPFAHIELPKTLEGTDVYLYMAKADDNPPAFKVSDIIRAREALGEA